MTTVYNPLVGFGFDAVGLPPNTILTPFNLFIPLITENMEITTIDETNVSNYLDENDIIVLTEPGFYLINAGLLSNNVFIDTPENEVVFISANNTIFIDNSLNGDRLNNQTAIYATQTVSVEGNPYKAAFNLGVMNILSVELPG